MKFKKKLMTLMTIIVMLCTLMEVEIFELFGFKFTTTELSLLLFIFLALILINITDFIIGIINFVKKQNLMIIILLISAILILIISTVYSPLIVEALKGNLRLLIAFIFGILFIYLWDKNLIDHKFIKIMIYNIVIIYIILSIAQYLFPSLNEYMTNFFAEGKLHYSSGKPRVTGTMINPNVYSWFLLSGIIFLISEKGSQLFFEKSNVLGIIMVIIAPFSLVHMQSRNIWIIYIITMMVLILNTNSKKIKVLIFCSIICLLVSIIIIFPNRINLTHEVNSLVDQIKQINFFQQNNNTEKLKVDQTLVKNKSNSIKELPPRLIVWKAAVKIGLTNPVTGIGRGVFKNVFPDYIEVEKNMKWAEANRGDLYAHNIFLSWFSEFGILGFLIVAGLLLYLIYKTLLLTSLKMLPIWVSIFGTGFFDDFTYFYIYLVFSIIFAYIIYDQYSAKEMGIFKDEA